VAVAVTRRGQHLADGGNVNLNVVFFHHHAGPYLRHQLVLGYQLAVAAHQHQQDFERALPKRHRDTVGQQLAPPDQPTEWSEGESFAHWITPPELPAVRRTAGGADCGHYGVRNSCRSRSCVSDECQRPPPSPPRASAPETAAAPAGGRQSGPSPPT